MDRTQLLILLSTLNTAIIKALQDTNRALPWVLSKPLRALVALVLGAVEAGIEAVALGSGAFLPMVVTTLTASAPSLILLVVEMANTKPGEPLKSVRPPPPAVLGVMGLCLVLWMAGCSATQKKTEMDIAHVADTAKTDFERICGTDQPFETCARYIQQITSLFAVKQARLAASRGDAGSDR